MLVDFFVKLIHYLFVNAFGLIYVLKYKTHHQMLQDGEKNAAACPTDRLGQVWKKITSNLLYIMSRKLDNSMFSMIKNTCHFPHHGRIC